MEPVAVYVVQPVAIVEVAPPRDLWVVAAGLALATAAWAWTLGGDMGPPMAASGMDMAEAGASAMPPTAWSPGQAALMFAMWWVMMAAMMLPGAAPLVLTAAAVHRRRGRAGWPELIAGLLTAGYLVVWGIFSLAATFAQWALEESRLIAPEDVADAAAGWISLAVGLYQLTPLKRSCLRHCRSPIRLLGRYWRSGATGAFRMGLAHGVYCLGCCGALMVLLFAGGVMNPFWIGVLAFYVLVEKHAAEGLGLSLASGLGLAGIGIVLLAQVA
ncbi:MAG: DUF2182 domain-containing protein [Geminicoccaceae bacterium]